MMERMPWLQLGNGSILPITQLMGYFCSAFSRQTGTIFDAKYDNEKGWLTLQNGMTMSSKLLSFLTPMEASSSCHGILCYGTDLVTLELAASSSYGWRYAMMTRARLQQQKRPFIHKPKIIGHRFFLAASMAKIGLVGSMLLLCDNQLQKNNHIAFVKL